jgi:hypothetical protein
LNQPFQLNNKETDTIFSYKSLVKREKEDIIAVEEIHYSSNWRPKMKKSLRGLALCAFTLLAVLSITSCSVILGWFNKAPTVSIDVTTASPYYSDQSITFQVTASDPDGDTLTYSWAVNGTPVTGDSDQETYYWLTATTLNPDITVTVDDGNDHLVDATQSITINPAASLRLINNSDYTITEMYIALGSSTSWGSDRLSTNLPPGYFTKFLNIDSGSYDFRARVGTTTSWDTTTYVPRTSFSMNPGYYRDFTLTNTSWNISANKNTSIATPSIVAPLGQGSLKSEGGSDASTPFLRMEILPIGGLIENAAREADPNRNQSIPFNSR